VDDLPGWRQLFDFHSQTQMDYSVDCGKVDQLIRKHESRMMFLRLAFSVVIVKPHLHDATGCQTGCNRLFNCAAGCQTGLTTGV